ncbi:Tmh18p [Sporobolomyces salmoneus]|uniref:Tmh18p n=1 Tax=Sporobolomyces salmoneus TaxID=183962 RepID=UPI00317AA172
MSDQVVTPSFYRAVTSTRGVHNLIAGTLLGSTLWHGFIGGIVSYRTLPRQQFGLLQSKLFPHYFRLQSLGSFALLGLYHRAGKLVRSDRNMWVLSAMAVTSSLNWLIIGPWTTAVMKKRHRRERIEGKDYNSSDVSTEMKALNSKFGVLHSVSSVLNLGFLGAVILATATSGAYGIGL